MTEQITYKEYATIINRVGQWLIGNNKIFIKRNLYGYFGREADRPTVEHALRERYNKNIFTDDGLTAEFVECAIVDNKDHSFLPNYVLGTNGRKYMKDEYVDMAKRVSKWEVDEKKSPNIVYLKKETSSTGGTLCKKLSDKLGVNITGKNSLYSAFYNAIYLYYLNDKKTQAQALSALKVGLNCVDLNQLAYYALKELGWGDNVRIVRGDIYCTSTFGHVWCQVHENGVWKHFDVSAAAKGRGQGSLICGTKYKITNVNPNWLLTDDGKT